MKKIIARNEEWLDVILGECQSLVSFNSSAKMLSVWEQLQCIFNNGEEYDEKFRKRIVKENNLHISIEKGDICHLSATVREALILGEELLRMIPSSLSVEPDLKRIDRKAYHFSERGEQAVFDIVRNTNVAMVEVTVRTDAEDIEDLVYWSKDKLIVMNFVAELDDEHSISTIYSL